MEWVKKNWPLAQFTMVDDVFIPSTAWLARFVEEYRRRVNLPFTCLLRLDRVDDEQARLLSEAGCSLVLAAIESGDERYPERSPGPQNDRRADNRRGRGSSPAGHQALY